MTARFSSVCEATCPTASPRHQRPRAGAPREPLRDAHHQPPVEHDAQRRRGRHHHPLLHGAEGNDVEARGQLVAGEQRHDLAHLLLRGAGEDGPGMEVDEGDAASPAHHAVRRHRRVDAPREQAQGPPADARRQPARAALALQRVVGAIRQHLDPHVDVGPAQIHLPAAGGLDAAPELALDSPATCAERPCRRGWRAPGSARRRRPPRRGRRGRGRCPPPARRARARPGATARSWRCRRPGRCARARRPSPPPARASTRCVPSAPAPGRPSRSAVASRRLRTRRSTNHGRLRPLSAIS